MQIPIAPTKPIHSATFGLQSSVDALRHSKPVAISATTSAANRIKSSWSKSKLSTSIIYFPPRRDRPSHRLEVTVERDVDQQRRIALDALRHQIGRLVHRLGALGIDAERTRQPDKIDRRDR